MFEGEQAVQIAHDLIHQWSKSRGVGHTDSSLRGLQGYDKSIFVTYCNYFGYEGLPSNITQVGLQDLHKLKGFNCPMQVDHFAVQQLLWELIKHIHKLELKIQELDDA